MEIGRVQIVVPVSGPPGRTLGTRVVCVVMGVPVVVMVAMP